MDAEQGADAIATTVLGRAIEIVSYQNQPAIWTRSVAIGGRRAGGLGETIKRPEVGVRSIGDGDYAGACDGKG